MPTTRDHTTSASIWYALSVHMSPSRWYDVQEIYDLVRTNVELVPGDFDGDSPHSTSPRWERNVRNVLQRRKTAGDLEWDHAGRYQIT